MNYHFNNPSLGALEKKLQMMSEGQELELTPEEAMIYGADYADEYPQEETDGKEADDGRK